MTPTPMDSTQPIGTSSSSVTQTQQPIPTVQEPTATLTPAAQEAPVEVHPDVAAAGVTTSTDGQTHEIQAMQEELNTLMKTPKQPQVETYYVGDPTESGGIRQHTTAAASGLALVEAQRNQAKAIVRQQGKERDFGKSTGSFAHFLTKVQKIPFLGSVIGEVMQYAT